MKKLVFVKDKVNIMQLFDELPEATAISFDKDTKRLEVMVTDGVTNSAVQAIIDAHSAQPPIDIKAAYAAAPDKLAFIAKRLGLV